MGFLQAKEMALITDLEAGLLWHLQANHFPPVSVNFLPACIQAIESVQDENYDHEITMPNGKALTAREIVLGLHLEPWLE